MKVIASPPAARSPCRWCTCWPWRLPTPWPVCWPACLAKTCRPCSRTPGSSASSSAFSSLLALSMFGFYELQLPSSWQTRLTEQSNQQRGGRLGGVAVMGFLSALIVGPCVAPPLAAALIVIGELRQPAAWRVGAVRHVPGHGCAAECCSAWPPENSCRGPASG